MAVGRTGACFRALATRRACLEPRRVSGRLMSSRPSVGRPAASPCRTRYTILGETAIGPPSGLALRLEFLYALPELAILEPLAQGQGERLQGRDVPLAAVAGMAPQAHEPERVVRRPLVGRQVPGHVAGGREARHHRSVKTATAMAIRSNTATQEMSTWGSMASSWLGAGAGVSGS